MKSLFLAALVALAALAAAIPSVSAAALPATCSLGPTTPGGDTDCRATEGGCMAHVHLYDVEDHPNVYEADCSGCGVHLGTGQAVRLDCYTPPPLAMAAPQVPCHRNGSNDLVCHATAGGCVVDSYMYDKEDALNHYEADCGCVQVDNYHHPAVYTTCIDTAAAADPALPCQSGIAQTWCDVSAGPCDARVTPWTAWGDRSLEADCSQGMTRCHVEEHTDTLLAPEHWCAF